MRDRLACWAAVVALLYQAQALSQPMSPAPGRAPGAAPTGGGRYGRAIGMPGSHGLTIEGHRIYPENGEFGRITDGGTFCDGAFHPAARNGFATLAQLRATYPFATSWNDPVDGLEIQAAWNAAGVAGYGVVVLPAGRCYAPLAGLVHPRGTGAQLWGAGSSTVILGSKAIAAGNPVVTVEDTAGSLTGPVSHLMIAGLDSANNSTRTNAGVAYSPMYVPGSRGLRLTTSPQSTYTDLWFRNLDLTLDWSISPGNNYITTFRDCAFFANNIGVPIIAAETREGKTRLVENSFEKMRIENSVIGNNNIGLYVQLGDGRGQSIVADVYVTGTSLDYNIVKQAVIVGAVLNNVHQNHVYLDQDHIETDSEASGTASRIENNGDLSLTNSELVELGSLPTSMVAPGSYYASTYLQGNHQTPNPFTFVGDKAGGVFPLVFDGGYNQGGNFYATTQGNIGSAHRLPAFNVLAQPYTLGDEDNHDGQHLTIAAGGGSITVPRDGAGPFFMTNTRITITCILTTSACSLVAGQGVTIRSGGTSLTFGGRKPVDIHLTKTAPDTWVATGEMN